MSKESNYISTRSDGMTPNNVFGDQENSIVANSSTRKEESFGKGFNSKTKERTKSRIRHIRINVKKAVQSFVEEVDKKEEHNAKERIRRMKLNASYLSLGSLIPNSRAKKRWTAPVIIDKALQYIPQLEKEIDELRLKKNHIQSAVETRQLLNQEQNSQVEALTIAVSQVKKGEAIFQICRKRGGENVLSDLFGNIEDEGICIVSASTILVCDERLCYHIHVQVSFFFSCYIFQGNFCWLTCILHFVIYIYIYMGEFPISYFSFYLYKNLSSISF
ncbi:hypothetical protein UlMin_033291 [Ulmus minor]